MSMPHLLFNQKLAWQNYKLTQMDQHEKVIMSCCPFDKMHVVEAKRLSKHIEKCKSPRRADYMTCKYNSSHWFLIKDQLKHLQRCENNWERGKEKIGARSGYDQSEISTIKIRQSQFEEDDSILVLAKNQGPYNKRSNNSRKEESFDYRKERIFQQLSKVSEEGGIWRQPSFRDFVKDWKRREKKSKSRAPPRNADDSF